MKSKIFDTILVILLVLCLACWILVNRYARAEFPFEPAGASGGQGYADRCQYPFRDLRNGQCDNSDPACPETLKEGLEGCHSAENQNIYRSGPTSDAQSGK